MSQNRKKFKNKEKKHFKRNQQLIEVFVIDFILYLEVKKRMKLAFADQTLVETS